MSEIMLFYSYLVGRSPFYICSAFINKAEDTVQDLQSDLKDHVDSAGRVKDCNCDFKSSLSFL